MLIVSFNKMPFVHRQYYYSHHRSWCIILVNTLCCTWRWHSNIARVQIIMASWLQTKGPWNNINVKWGLIYEARAQTCIKLLVCWILSSSRVVWLVYTLIRLLMVWYWYLLAAIGEGARHKGCTYLQDS